jgi:hypothetical protein
MTLNVSVTLPRRERCEETECPRIGQGVSIVPKAATGRFSCLSAPKQKGPAAAAVRADAQIAVVGMTAGLGECRDLAGVGGLILRANFPYPVPEQVSS